MLLLSCESVRADYYLEPCAEEVERAANTMVEIRRSWPLRPTGDPVVEALQEFTDMVAKRTGEAKHREWRTYVVRDSQRNAISIGGGRIFVTEGLLRFVEGAEELAALLTHEFAHHIAGHFCEGVRKRGWLSGWFGGGEDSSGRVGNLVASMDLERELEADWIGASMLEHGSYNPRVAVYLVARMLRANGPGDQAYGERMQALQEFLAGRETKPWTHQSSSSAYRRLKEALE
ncbi:MAG: M48 family metallopeptidase [Gammaproteobacteria bacterium]